MNFGSGLTPVLIKGLLVICLCNQLIVADPSCRAKKDVVLPEYHFVDHRIEILNHDKDYNNVVVYENAVARPQASTLPSRAK